MKTSGETEHRAPKTHEGFRLRARLRYLYHGTQPTAVKFRLMVIAIDLVIIGFFISAPLLKETGWAFYIIDYLIAFVLALDLAARAYAYHSIKDWLKRPIVWVDLFVLATLLFPAWLANFGFLRLLRFWSLLNSDLFWHTIGRKFDHTRVEDITRAAAALVTFIFVTTGFVYAYFRGKTPEINGYVDALYFTVATLTTTGFGDVTLPGVWGRLIAITIMLVGITLFFRLAQSLIRANKIKHQCDNCGLQRHDVDAVHCKACGVVLNIPDEGH